jgi:hypothetical protein
MFTGGIELSEQEHLEAIEIILERKKEIVQNPFSNLPTASIKEALKLLEEYGEDFTFSSKND